jgi:hypothetical protein
MDIILRKRAELRIAPQYMLEKTALTMITYLIIHILALISSLPAY